MSHDIFISHSSKDKVIADLVCAGLETEEMRCWVAPRDIRPGDSWGGSIIDAIAASKVMVIIFSSNSNSSKQVMREVERAVQKDVVVVPFRIDEVEPSRDMEYFLSSTHWLDAVTPGMDSHVASLVSTVRSILDKPSNQVTLVSDLQGPENQTKAAVGRSSQIDPSQIDPSQIDPSQIKSSGTKPKKFPMSLILVGVGILLGMFAVYWFMGQSDDSATNQQSVKQNNEQQRIEVPTKQNVKESANVAADGDVSLKVAKVGVAADLLPISWSGNTSPKDYVVIGKVDANDRSWLQRVPVGNDSRSKLVIPDAPGQYEVRYFNAASRKVIARSPLKVTLPELSLSADAQAIAGSDLEVQWKAPNNKSDILAIANKGSAGNKKKTYAYTTKGSPTQIRVPDEVGHYELRYISGQKQSIWASTPIEVIAPEVSIAATTEAIAGSHQEIIWSGPSNTGDILVVAKPGSKGNKYINYIYPRVDRDAILKMPERAGEYEIRYVSGQSKQTWAKQMIDIRQPEVSLTVPDSIVVGSTIQIDWSGPANKSDFISVAEIGSPGKKYLNYTYVREDHEAKLAMPEAVGKYEVRYISGQKRNIWAKQDIVVTQAEVSLAIVARALAGSDQIVEWTGPANNGDYIAISLPDSNVKKYISYKYVKPNSTLKIKIPDTPGSYEVRYVSAQKRHIWATAKVESYVE